MKALFIYAREETRNIIKSKAVTVNIKTRPLETILKPQTLAKYKTPLTSSTTT
jgi:hypothetical protein